jgi:diguanylate cyclase (GGDEF)-like protein/PAS domain S-box-containing protein
MKRPQTPGNEEARQRALDETGLLDSAPDAAFDDITALVAARLGVPICLVSLVDRDRQWFKSRHGLDATQTPRDVSFCGHVVFDGAALVVEDATADARFADNPLVAGPPHVRAYAGVPLTAEAGLTLGTLCAIDHASRRFTPEDLDFLNAAARLVTNLIRHRTLDRLKDVELRAALDAAGAAVLFVDASGGVVWASRRAGELLALADRGARAEQISFAALFAEPAAVAEAVAAAIGARKSAHNLVFEVRGPDGAARTLRVDIDPHTGAGTLAHARCSLSDPSGADTRDMRLRQYSALFDASPELLATLDGRGHLDQVNPSWRRVLGWSPDELRARPLVSFAHPEDAALLTALLDMPSSVAGDAPALACRIRARDGSYRLLAPSVSGEDGAVGFSARDITAQSAVEDRVAFGARLDRELSDLQRAYIQKAGATPEWWERALSLLIRITGSEYGFIGSIHTDASGRFLRTHAITNIAWDEPTRRLYEESRVAGMEFRNLDTLFGRVMADGRTLVSNDVEHDPRAHGRPAGHPPLRHFLGLACGQGDQMVGMVGLANRPSGYEPEIVADLEAAAVVLAAVIHQSEAEARRVRVESRLRGIVDSTADVIVTIDRRGTVLSVNPAIRAVFGYEPEECIGQNVSMLMNPHHGDWDDGHLQRLVAAGDDSLLGKGREVLGRRKDGRDVNIELTVWASEADPGQGFHGIMRDVTERVRDERQLRESAAQLASALALARAGHWELDLAANLFTFNDGFYRIFGVTAAEVGGYRLSPQAYAARFVHPDDAAIVRDEIARALASDGLAYTRDLEHRFLDAAGHVGYLAVGIRGTRDADGALRMLHGVVQDVTSRREREQERQQMAEQSRATRALAARVAELDRARAASGLLTECVTFLQRAISVPEGMDIIARHVARMYAEANIAVYATLPDTDELVLHTDMPRFGGMRSPETIEPTDCWALRSRGVYAVYDGGSHVPCRHCAPGAQGMFLCAPITGADRTIGLVTIALAPGYLADDAVEGDGRIMRELSRFETMAQSLSGAMSTIVLRESLQRLALVDELTGLPNRRAFMGGAARIAGRARRAKDPIVVAIFDVDHFKSINDRFGHDEGDRVLRRLADIATATFRQDDLIGRLGGEEFGIFLVGTEDGVRKRLEAFRDAISRAGLLAERPVTVSIGYAVAAPEESVALDALLKAADTALYAAKAGGRNRVMPDPGASQPPA